MGERKKRKKETRPRRFYTEEEIQFLKENYGKLSLDEMAEALGRKKTAVSLKLHTLGITKKATEKRRARLWQNDNFIVQNMGVMNINELAEHVNLTKSGVYRRFRNAAPRRGIRVVSVEHRFYTDADKEIIRKFYPEEGSSCNVRMEDYHSRESVRATARKMKIKVIRYTEDGKVVVPKPSRVNTDENRKWLLEHREQGIQFCAKQLNCSKSMIYYMMRVMKETGELIDA